MHSRAIIQKLVGDSTSVQKLLRDNSKEGESPLYFLAELESLDRKVQASLRRPGGTHRRNTAGHQIFLELLLKGELNPRSRSTTCFFLGMYRNLVLHCREKLIKIM